MTARQVFEATLIELSKIQAPSLKLYEFNYLFNKAINLYINKVYNVYDINQQTTDDLRVLKSTAYLTPNKVNKENNPLHNSEEQAKSYLSTKHTSILSLHGATYEVFMPLDYLHMLNCVCIYYVAKQKDCWDAGSYIEVPATRLTADSWSQIVTDIYNRPSPMRPYYYVHNVNKNEQLPTNPDTDISKDYYVTDSEGKGPSYESFKEAFIEKIFATSTYTDNKVLNEAKSNITTATVALKEYNKTWDKDLSKVDWETTMNLLANASLLVKESKEDSNFPRTFKLNSSDKSLVEKPIASRVGNVSNVRCEIRYGKDDTLFQLKEVQIDYVKCPQFIRLTQELIDLTEDTSQMMEFPDYVNQEIINELVHLVMERTADPRLSTNILMTQSIARPTGQLQQQPTAQES